MLIWLKRNININGTRAERKQPGKSFPNGSFSMRHSSFFLFVFITLVRIDKIILEKKGEENGSELRHDAGAMDIAPPSAQRVPRPRP